MTADPPPPHPPMPALPVDRQQAFAAAFVPTPDPQAQARAEAAAQDPDLVWHYTDGNGLVSILSHHVLWATSAAFLNDAQEVALGTARIRERLTELAERDGADPGIAALVAALDSAGSGTSGPSAASFFILSASRAWDSLAMWRNYGGAYESYAIGLDARSPLAVLGEADSSVVRRSDDIASGTDHKLYLKRQAWEPVRYALDDQVALVDAVVDELPARMAWFADAVGDRDAGAIAAAAPTQDVVDDITEVLDDLEQALLLIKHDGFGDERESRHCWVLYADPTDELADRTLARLIRHRPTVYGIAPYLQLTGSDPGTDPLVTPTARPLPIRALAISPSPNGPLAEVSVRQLLRAKGYGDVPVLRSKIPFRG